MFNGALKRLDNDLDLWAVLRPLLDEQGHAIAHIQRMQKQMERMIKIKDDFLRNEQELKEQECKEREQQFLRI